LIKSSAFLVLFSLSMICTHCLLMLSNSVVSLGSSTPAGIYRTRLDIDNKTATCGSRMSNESMKIDSRYDHWRCVCKQQERGCENASADERDSAYLNEHLERVADLRERAHPEVDVLLQTISTAKIEENRAGTIIEMMMNLKCQEVGRVLHRRQSELVLLQVVVDLRLKFKAENEQTRG
jgi:hypothetical protein